MCYYAFDMHVSRPEPPHIACKSCGARFTPRTRWQSFCSDKCRNNYHNDQKYMKTGEIPLIKCPNCNTDMTDKNMIEEISDGLYLCNCCSKTFEVI